MAIFYVITVYGSQNEFSWYALVVADRKYINIPNMGPAVTSPKKA
jgi:hypothetical protein